MQKKHQFYNSLSWEPSFGWKCRIVLLKSKLLIFEFLNQAKNIPEVLNVEDTITIKYK